MVRLRVTVTVLPEDVYLATQDAHLPPRARSAPTRRFMVACESPETWTIGQFANKIKDAYSKTYKGEDLGTIKYIKDEDDADLHTDLSVYDALVDAGYEAIHKSDQRAKITIIQEQGFPLRGASVVPDLSVPCYQVPPSRPPPPPLFPISLQAPSSARKRSREVALGEDGSSAHSPTTRPNHRPRLASTSVVHAEYTPMESVELATLEGDDQILNYRRDAPVDLTHDPQFSMSRRATNVGHDMADRWTPADVEPKSESPDAQVPLKNLEQTSRFSLEAVESVAAPIQTLPIPASFTQFDKQGNILEKCNNLTPRQNPLDYVPLPPSTTSSTNRRALVLAETSAPKGFQDYPNAGAPLQEQARLRTWYNRSAPITPPSDVFQADTKGSLTHPAPISAASSIIVTSALNKFKPTFPRQRGFEPQSSIEDSQMSPRSKKKSTSHTNTESALTTKVHNGSRPPEAAKAKFPFSEIARLYKRDAPVVSGKRAQNEPVYNFSETRPFLSDTDDHQPQSYQVTARHELEPAIVINDATRNEESTDRSLADGEEKNEGISKTSSKANSFEYRRSHPAMSDDQSTSLSRERSGSVGQSEGDSNKENHCNGRNTKPSGVQEDEPQVDAKMVDVFSADDVQIGTQGSRKTNEPFEGVDISATNMEAPMDPRSKYQNTIDILNSGSSIRDNIDASRSSNWSRRNFRIAARQSMEAQEIASVATDSQTKLRRRKKKSHVNDSSPHVETGIILAGSSIASDEPSNEVSDCRRAVLGDVQLKSNYANARSEVETPSSAESAGDQLRESLHAFTQEHTQSTKATASPSGDSRFLSQSKIKMDARPIKNKVYEGVIRANEGASALVELQGIKGNPCGLLHKNGASLTPFRGSIAQVVSLEQVVKVKVIHGTVTNGSGTFIKLSMLNIDQATGEPIQPSLAKSQKQSLKPRENLKNVASEHDLPTDAGSGEDIPNSQAQPKVNQDKKVDVDDQSAITIKEHHGEVPQAFVGIGVNAKSDSDVDITGSFERVEAPDSRSTPEPRFGLGFTNTPRKRKKGAANVEGADSPAVPVAASVRSGQKGKPIELRDAPMVDAHSNGQEDTQDAITPQNGAARVSSAAQSKRALTKFHSKPKLGKMRPKARGSVQGTSADAKPDNILPQDGRNMSTDQSERNLGGNKSPPTESLPTAKISVEPEEYLAFPPTMTKEQYLAQRRANAAAIARRNAAAGEKAVAMTSSGSAKVHLGNQSKKLSVKKQKDKPAEDGPLSTAFETPPPMVQPAHRMTFEDKEQTVQHTSRGATPKALNYDKKSSKNDQDNKDRQQSEHDRALPTKSEDKGKGQGVRLAYTEASALKTEARTTPTLSRSTLSTPTKASNNTVSKITVNLPQKPEAKATDPKRGLAKPLTADRAQVKMPLNSKALSMAELKARKEAAKKSTKGSSSLLPLQRSSLTSSISQTVLALESDSDESESESESESSSEGTNKQEANAILMKRKVFQRPLSQPDPTIRDRSLSIDIDDEDSD